MSVFDRIFAPAGLRSPDSTSEAFFNIAYRSELLATMLQYSLLPPLFNLLRPPTRPPDLVGA
jgi:hypothetical protein